MNEPAPPVKVVLRIPGPWSEPSELLERMPAGYRLGPEALILPSGAQVKTDFARPDEEFPGIFRTSLRRPATQEELAISDNYEVNVLLSGPGGSLEAAKTLLEAGASFVQAGAAGVFIDNCGLSFGGELWLQMAEDGSSDAVSFAFVSIIRSETEVWTMGFHVLGMRDVIMKRADVEQGGYDIVEVIRYLARGEKPVDDRHVIADLDGPRFQCFAEDGDARTAGSPMYNPFGRLRLVSLRDIADNN
ncbi:MAG: hypothetical protein ACKVP0_19495 [Pirellulaceae bacterium]